MRGNELLNKMELIDPAYVEEAGLVPEKNKNIFPLCGFVTFLTCQRLAFLTFIWISVCKKSVLILDFSFLYDIIEISI